MMQGNRNRAGSLYAAAAMLVLAMATGIFTGTAGAGLARSDVAVVRVDSRDAHVALVQTRLADQRLQVDGYLRKRFQPHGPIPGQLLIEVLAVDGSVLQRTVSSYHRRNAHSGKAYFSESLEVTPDVVGSIRVTHIGLGRAGD